MGNAGAVDASVVQGKNGSAAVCGSGPLRRASRASREASVAPGRPPLVLTGSRGGVIRSPRTCRVGVLCRVRSVWQWRHLLV